jgi:hypothetical protein
MGKRTNALKPNIEELQRLQGQLRREIELAQQKGIPSHEALRLLGGVNKDIEKLRQKELKGNLFDMQMELF